MDDFQSRAAANARCLWLYRIAWMYLVTEKCSTIMVANVDLTALRAVHCELGTPIALPSVALASTRSAMKPSRSVVTELEHKPTS